MQKRILLLIAIAFLGACSADDSANFKAPSSLLFTIDVDRSPSKLGRLEFTGGFLRMSSFQLDGDRVEAEDYFFQNGYNPPIEIIFDTLEISPYLQFDLPQGIYNTIQLNFEIPSANINTLEVYGRHKNAQGTWIDLRLEVDSFEHFSFLGRNANGNTEIVLQEGFSRVGKIVLNPAHWFSALSWEQLEAADRAFYNGDSLILINRNMNSGLYNEIDNRLDELNQLIIP